MCIGVIESTENSLQDSHLLFYHISFRPVRLTQAVDRDTCPVRFPWGTFRSTSSSFVQLDICGKQGGFAGVFLISRNVETYTFTG